MVLDLNNHMEISQSDFFGGKTPIDAQGVFKD